MVLLNPLATSSHVWQPLLGAFENYEVFLLDYPGFMGVEAELVDSVEDMSQRAMATLKDLGRTNIHLIGYSFGSWVAQQIALSEEIEVRSLTLIGSSDRIYQMGILMIDKWLEMLDQMGFEAVLGQTCFWNFAPMTFQRSPDILQKFVGGTLVACADVSIFRNQLEVSQAYSKSPDLSRILAPTLILRGEFDCFYPKMCSAALDRGIPNSEYKEIPSAGHAAIWENPLQVASLISDFLAKHDE